MKILTALILIIFCISCNKKTESQEVTSIQTDTLYIYENDNEKEETFFELKTPFKLLYIEYTERLNGYKVTGVFSPEYISGLLTDDVALYGGVLLTFSKEGREFNVKHDYYRLDNLFTSKKHYLQQLGKMEEVIITDKELPFNLQDVNFDGKDELVIPQYGNISQRSALYMSFYDITSKIAKPLEGLPYGEVDNLLLDKVFNESDKTISTYNSSGWCGDSEFKYKKNAKGDFYLDSYIRYTEDTTGDSIRCRKDTYKITMSLVKSEFPE